MTPKAQIFCAWTGILFMAVFFVGWVFFASAFFPPHSPLLGAEEIAQRYNTNTNLLRFGLILLMVSGGLFVTYSAAISAQLLKMDSPNATVLSISQAIAGAINALFFVLSPVLWGAAAFRPDRNPEIIQAMNDFGWFMFFQPVSFLLVQTMVVAYAILTDKSSQPVFPRWVGFLNIWIGLIFIPSYCITFFKSGPFAWNGLICFWIPVGVFGPWVIVMVKYLIAGARQWGNTAPDTE